MPESFVCWKCGAELVEVLLPLARHAECPQCRAQLRVCRMCMYFDPAAPQQCREPVADLVTDKMRANFCGYFQIRPNAFVASSDKAAASRRQLDALFGSEASGSASGEGRSPEDVAREKLEGLFKK